MRFASMCSGIEAASVAFNPLGWQAQFFSEIAPFPRAVLKHHYPTIPNLGDMTKFKDWPDATLDLLCGGTPCQSFSNAGLRAGLDDPRGDLMLAFCAVAARYRPRWVLWENVPGVLSSNGGRDFGTFLGLMGLIGYGFAYRVLDAQYFGLAQRRKRVFVVAYLGDWRRAAAVLFERQGLRWDPPPSRSAGQDVAGTVAGGAQERGGYSTDDIPLAGTLQAGSGKAAGSATQQDAESGLLIAGTVLAQHGRRMTEGVKDGLYAIASTLMASTGNSRGAGTPPGMLAYGGADTRGSIDVATALRAKGGTGHNDFESETFIAFDTTQITHPENRSNPSAGDPCHPLTKTGHAPAIAFQSNDNGCSGAGEIASSLKANSHNGNAPATTSHRGVRRLTPRECERLQGLEDDYTLITYRGKPAKDGPRYSAIGNSWAVPNIRWIGQRIAMVDSL